MHYSRIVISNLKTYDDCSKAIDDIENDYRNIQGGMSSWNSGYESHLLEGAKKKLAAVNRKQEKCFIKGLKLSYKEYVKKNPTITWETYYEDELFA